jgi:hypothetical protein
MNTKLLYVSSTATANRADGSAERPYAMLEAHGSGGQLRKWRQWRWLGIVIVRYVGAGM